MCKGCDNPFEISTFQKRGVLYHLGVLLRKIFKPVGSAEKEWFTHFVCKWDLETLLIKIARNGSECSLSVIFLQG